jgi:hypothetical protein
MRPVLVATVLAALVAAPAAHTAVSVSASNGTVNPDGSATVPVSISCTPGSVVLEAHLSLSQDDGAIWGMAGIANVRCTGKTTTYHVTVRPHAGAFHAGTAYASPYVLTQRRGTGATESGGSAASISLE